MMFDYKTATATTTKKEKQNTLTSTQRAEVMSEEGVLIVTKTVVFVVSITAVVVGGSISRCAAAILVVFSRGQVLTRKLLDDHSCQDDENRPILNGFLHVVSQAPNRGRFHKFLMHNDLGLILALK